MAFAGWDERYPFRVGALAGVLMMVVLANAAGFGSLVQAKSVDHTPDITSDAYWDTHNIARVRVENVGRQPSGPETLTWSLVDPISEPSIAPTGTVPLSFLWYGMNADAPPEPRPGEEFVVYYAKQGPSAIAVTLLRPNTGGDQVLAALHKIEALRRGSGGHQAVGRAAFDSQLPVALYALNRLLNDDPRTIPTGYATHLLNLRDDSTRDPAVRIAASRLASRLTGTEGSDAEYQWLQTAILQEKGADWTAIAPFFRRLLEFPSKREATVDFATRIVAATAYLPATRIAAYSIFDDPILLRSDEPDAITDRVFTACLGMLADPAPMLRRAGAVLLYGISKKVAPPRNASYQALARQALTNAITNEKDPATLVQLERYAGKLP